MKQSYTPIYTPVNDAVMDAQKHGLIEIESKAKELVLFYGKNRDMPFVLVSLAQTDGTVKEALERKAG